MSVNIYSPSTFTTSILIGDTTNTINAGHDSIPLLSVQNGSPVSAALEIQSTDTALLLSRMTTAQMNAIPNPANGMLIYNTTVNQMYSYTAGAWIPVAEGAVGDVVGPNVSITDDIAIFADTSGKVLADSGVNITKVPLLMSFALRSQENLALRDPLVTNGNQIGNLNFIQFVNDVGSIFVDALLPVQFITNDYGPGSQTCSLFNGAIPSSSTSPSALVELQSTTGALLLSRMNTTEQNALLVPSGSGGMIIFNTDTSTLNFYNGSSWTTISTYEGNSWIDQTGTTVTMSANTNYVADNSSLVTLTLPSTCAFGSTFIIQGKGSGGWQIAQNSGQQINFGNTATTSGTSGYLASTNTFDSVTLVCISTNSVFAVYSAIGNITVN